MFALPGRSNALRRTVLFVALAFAALATFALPGGAAQRSAIVLSIDGAIGPATASYISGGLEQARNDGAEFVIIEMDTPGGLDTSMREIIRAILAMPVPVVAYVHPSGARAASAGTYILYASHIAAMTPGTNLGAATPIQIGAVPSQPGGDQEGEASKPAPASAEERKAVNDATAYIRSLAELRGRNAEWAEQAVREASSLSADAALADNVVNIVAKDPQSLLAQLDGVKVTVNGTERTLHTGGVSLTKVEPGLINRMLATITNPNVAIILMMLGVYGLFFEFWNPGSFFPGTLGAISLLLGLYALAVLPIDYVGLALIVLGFGLMIAEAFVPSFGTLGIGGIASFIIGAAMLFDTDVPAFQLNWSIIASLAVFSAGLIIVVARMGLRSFRTPVTTGSEELIGASGSVLDWSEGRGHVFVHSERWNAVGPASMPPDGEVKVDSIDGLQLTVSPIDRADN